MSGESHPVDPSCAVSPLQPTQHSLHSCVFFRLRAPTALNPSKLVANFNIWWTNIYRQRKQYTGAFKAKIAVEAIKGQRTIQELATARGVHPNQITSWKKQLLASAEDIFSGARERRDQVVEQEKD